MQEKVIIEFDSKEYADKFVEWFYNSGEYHFKSESSKKPNRVDYDKSNRRITISNYSVRYAYIVYDGRVNNLRDLESGELEEKLLELNILGAFESAASAEKCVIDNGDAGIVQYIVDNTVLENPEIL